MRKILNSKWPRIFLFVLGFLICVYPLVSGAYQSWQQGSLIQTFESEVAETSESDLHKMLDDAEKYNSLLFQTQDLSVNSVDSDILSKYDDLLSTNENGIMSRLEIPKISVNLPVYHGTEDEVLDVGTGHLQGSSLPVGGKSTRSVITGHRGLPNAKLFTRLDELENGDLIFIETLGEKMAYQIRDIQVVEPEDLDVIRIEPDKDLLTLITCTPYGINTHRLVVTGERVEYSEKQKAEITGKLPGWREMLFAVLPFVLLIYVILQALRERKHKRQKKMKDNITAFCKPDSLGNEVHDYEKEERYTDEND